jgi:HEPN domain-containing protein
VVLTRYAFETRYPGPFEPITAEEYRDAIRLAEAVVAWADSIMHSPGTAHGLAKP